ncbi:MAG: response regulator [Bacteriovoracaceae bacterium]|jgi:YesN/AraC family two-component response regulator|nr:response regulator [Bacteriovoracaceae bacterium]
MSEKLSFLVVDDEKMICEVLKETILMWYPDATIDTAEDGLEAFHKLSGHNYSMMVVDYKMPFFNGADLIQALRAKEGYNKELPIIMFSGFIPDVENLLSTFDKVFFLDKPMDLEKFQKYIRFSIASS